MFNSSLRNSFLIRDRNTFTLEKATGSDGRRSAAPLVLVEMIGKIGMRSCVGEMVMGKETDSSQKQTMNE